MTYLLLITNTETEATELGYIFIKNNLDKLLKYVDIIHLNNPVLSDIYNALKNYNPLYVVVWASHGGEKGVLTNDRHIALGCCGYDEELNLNIVGDNTSWFRNRHIYLLSCYSAKILGYKLYEAGAYSVAGYKSAFFYTDEESNIFFKIAYQYPLTLLESGSPRKAYQHTKNLFLSTARKYLHIDRITAKYLAHDGYSLILYH